MKSADKPARLKVLIIRNSTGAIGGAELSAIDQALVLKSLGQKPVFISGLKQLRNKPPNNVESHGWVRWQVSDGSTRRPRMLLVLPMLFIQAVYYARKIQPDVINPHSREDQIAFTLTKFIHRKPVVWKNAGDLSYQLGKENTSRLGHFSQWLLARAIRKADYIYSLNDEDNHYLIDNVNGLNPKRLLSIPSSILFANYELNVKAVEKNSKFIIGTAIHLHKHKGVHILIEAFKTACKNREDVELWVVGDGEYRQVLERMTGGDERIKFLGQQDNVSPYLAAMDVFIQPALSEPWGRNVKEAMYFGKAIIGSSTGGIAAQITDGKTGILVKPGSVSDLSGAITKLLGNSELRVKLGNNARAKANEEGDFSRIVKRSILPLYEKAYSKKTLLVDATPMVRKKIDGIGRYTTNLVSELSADFDVKLVGFWGDDFSSYPSFKSKRLPIPRRVYNQLYKREWVPAFGSDKDLMLYPNFVEFPKTTSRAVLVIHDLAYLTHPETVSAQNQKYLSKFVPQSIERAHKVITISNATKQKLAAHYNVNTNSIGTVPPAIDHSVFRPSSEKEKRRVLAKYRLPSKYVLFFGTLEPRKNITGCLEAYVRLPEHLKKQYSLVLAGSAGWQNEEINSRVNQLKNSGEKVFTPGYIDDADLPAIYSAASVFLFPSLDEGFGIPVIEAMACGAPVITSNIEVLKETAGNAALFADPKDYDAIADQLAKVLGSRDERQKLSEAGEGRSKMFTWNKSAEKLTELLIE